MTDHDGELAAIVAILEFLRDERKGTTTRFTMRALRWFAAQRITVRRILTVVQTRLATRVLMPSAGDVRIRASGPVHHHCLSDRSAPRLLAS